MYTKFIQTAENGYAMAACLKAVLLNSLDELADMPTTDLLERRYQHLRSYTVYQA